jgi:hypothetical protein
LVVDAAGEPSQREKNGMTDEEYDGEDSKLVKDLRKQLGTLSKERDDALAALTPLQTKLRQRDIADVLTERGLKPSIAKFIPSDVEKDGLDGWLQENAETFGLDLSAKDEVADAEASAQQRLAGVQSRNSAGIEAEFQRRLDNAKNETELAQIMLEARAAGV